MPDFLPFKTVEAFVSQFLQGRELPFDRDVSPPGEHVPAPAAVGDRVFEVRVANPSSQLTDRKFRIFLAVGKGVMRIPKQSHMIRTGASENLAQDRGGNKSV